MITIEYCEDGEPISDFNYEDWITRIKNYFLYAKEQDWYLKASTDIAIQALRLEIAKGNINCEDITFAFKDEKFKANKYGVFNKVPDGFCKAHFDLIWQIIRVGIDKHKEDKNGK